VDEFNSKSATTEERISELKNRSKENIQNKVGLWRRKWQPTPVFLPEESHGQRNLVGYIARYD